MSEVHGALIYCSCGETERIVDPQDGQTLFGAAAYRSLLHEQNCSGSTKIYPVWFDDEDDNGEEVIMTGNLPERQRRAVRTSGFYDR